MALESNTFALDNYVHLFILVTDARGNFLQSTLLLIFKEKV